MTASCFACCPLHGGLGLLARFAYIFGVRLVRWIVREQQILGRVQPLGALV